MDLKNTTWRRIPAIKLILATFIVAFATSSCRKCNIWGITGKGDNVTISRNTEAFNSIQLSADADVFYKQDSLYKLELIGQSNILAVLDTKVESNTLKICFKRNIWKHHKVKLIIHSPDIRKLSINGSGNIISENTLNGSELELAISGSGNINIPSIKLQRLTATISGSGDITVSGGQVNRSDFSISGSGDIDTENMVSSQNSSRISGSGNIILSVSENLDVNISGSGDVKYKGKPAVSSRISGSGRLIHIN